MQTEKGNYQQKGHNYQHIVDHFLKTMYETMIYLPQPARVSFVGVNVIADFSVENRIWKSSNVRNTSAPI